ncbi:hypothetical protein [Clostridium sp.]|jgi:hypothetical protein|uniref:hypothetical protein n=1 Tax=Clostridium sp. TaxID=1506 RepID=UPI002585774E|nr:hypothetical protein [Clostridium sp.]MDF2503271.1 putative lipoprotein [Clostridium sp.]
MLIKKLMSLLLVATMVLLLAGCSKDAKIPTFKDTLGTPIVHTVYNYNGQTKDNVLSIFNSVGDVKITRSDTNDLKVVVKLVQTKQIKDIDKKLANLVIKPRIQNGVIFYEPLNANDTTLNYWDWIKSNLNANGIQVNFDVQIPSTLKEIRIYNEVGNINLQNITAKIHAQTDVGSITGANLNPLDSAVFKANVPSNGKTGLNIKFSSIDNVNDITAGVTSGNIILNLPSGANYSHKQVESESMPVKYLYDMYSKKQIEYCREQSFKTFTPINIKNGKTVITTSKEGNVLINNK